MAIIGEPCARNKEGTIDELHLRHKVTFRKLVYIDYFIVSSMYLFIPRLYENNSPAFGYNVTAITETGRV
jgi:hypothetical protein